MSSTTVKDIFTSMDYGPAPEARSLADEWLQAHNASFGHYIGGSFTDASGGERFDSINPATGQVLASVAQGSDADVDRAFRAARAAAADWAATPGHVRARYLYALARQIQKHSRLFAVLDTLDNGKPIRETRDLDVPLAARHFYHHAGWAQLLETEFPGYRPVGVCGQIIPWNFPLLMLAWKVAPALAAGNTVVLKPAEFTPLTALLFAEITRHVGIPAGVFNLVTGDGDTGAALVGHDEVDKIAFTGSTEVGRSIRERSAGSNKKLSLELGGKSPFIVFDDADIDAAVEGVVDGIFLNQGEVCCAGSRLLVQEGLAENLYARIRRRMDSLRVGDPLDKAVDIGALVAPVQLERIRRLVEQGKSEGAACYQPDLELPGEGLYYPPTLFTDVDPSATISQEEIFGPVLVATTFRTPDEAVELANNTRYGLAASIWSENLDLALDVASKVKAGVVWVNASNMFDAAAGFGGYRESGFGREGGREGMYEYLVPDWTFSRTARPTQEDPAPVATLPDDLAGDVAAVVDRLDDGLDDFGDGFDAFASDPEFGLTGAEELAGVEQEQASAAAPGPETGSLAAAPATEGLPPIDTTPKLYIGGRQVRADSGYSYAITSEAGVFLGEVGLGNRKDIRNAVEAARKAKGWSQATAHNRAQVLYYLAENLSVREDELADYLDTMDDSGAGNGAREVEASIRRIYTYAAWADKYDGQVHATPSRNVTLAMNEPWGVMGVVAPTDHALLGLLSVVLPAIAMGNRVVAIPSMPRAAIMAPFYQLLDTSDVPAGTVNLVSGNRDELAVVLAQHDDVDSLWYCGSRSGAAQVEAASSGNLKATWVIRSSGRDWFDPELGEGREFLRRASQVKNIWVPYGE